MSQFSQENTPSGEDVVVLKNELSALRKQVKDLNQEHEFLLTTIKEKNDRIIALSHPRN